MGLPGAGKTWLAERLQKHLDCAWFNADEVRRMANDWDFTLAGRYRQANRMKALADFEHSYKRVVICDFVCPTVGTRIQFRPSLIIWMDTLESSRYEDTNTMFEKPELRRTDFQITHRMSEYDAEELALKIRKIAEEMLHV